jgi:alpha-L-fucosidase
VSRLDRRGFLAMLGAGVATPRIPGLGQVLQSARPVPTPSQLEWQRDELALFLHLGVNTFTNREWGDGKEDPAIFAPTALDARQWARAASAAGFRAMVLTAKHHDGFCLWPTRTTRHSVASSPWRGGGGDVVREFTDACKAEGLRAGLYLSPWDRNSPVYGDSPRYNDLYCDQLTELLTSYGTIHEVWFDGANGEGPNGKRQQYDWPRFWQLVRKLQPNAVMFSDAGPDIRWIGNETGSAGQTNWSTMDPKAVPYPGASGEGIIRALQEGDPDGTVWRPGETDVSIRPGWFYHPAEDSKVKTVEELVAIYFTSVGRNSKLLLNVPPTLEGRLHEIDAGRLLQLRHRLAALFAEDVVVGHAPIWHPTGPKRASALIEFPGPERVAISDLRENIARGQFVSRYELEGYQENAWVPLASGTTIGYRKLDRFEPRTLTKVRLRVEASLEKPHPIRIGLFRSEN